MLFPGVRANSDTGRNGGALNEASNVEAPFNMRSKRRVSEPADVKCCLVKLIM